MWFNTACDCLSCSIEEMNLIAGSVGWSRWLPIAAGASIECLSCLDIIIIDSHTSGFALAGCWMDSVGTDCPGIAVACSSSCCSCAASSSSRFHQGCCSIIRSSSCFPFGQLGLARSGCLTWTFAAGSLVPNCFGSCCPANGSEFHLTLACCWTDSGYFRGSWCWLASFLGACRPFALLSWRLWCCRSAKLELYPSVGSHYSLSNNCKTLHHYCSIQYH